MVSAPAAAFAQQAGAAKLSIELNTLSQQDSACRMIFLVKNAMGKDLERAVFETVLFKSDGSVDRLTLFDFQTLPAGRPRVRQFDISGTKCEALGRVLFNDVHVCTGEGITGSDCIDALELSTKTAVEVLG
ncbi:MAG: hypothetical protein CSA68_12230 [Rhodobacterales bacterium]|nr:MAG: hypothetical protein CSA68_12230 [Rhodobacterales bacterium]